jgi:HK97 family phage major capsid protein
MTTGTAGIMDNRTVLEKADLALSDLLSGGLLQPAQAQKFMRVLIKESAVLKMATVVPMKAPKQLIEKIRFSSRVLRAGAEATALALGDRSVPALSKVELDAQLFKAEVRMSNEVLEDSIERGDLRQTIMQMLADAIARDMDEVIVQGDTASGDAFLAQFNGVLKQAATNTVDAGDTSLNKTILKNLLQAMPSEFLRDMASLRFLTSVNAEIAFRDALADRATALGDKALMDKLAPQYSGIPVEKVPLFPENVGTGSHCTHVLLLDPKNINVGIWRNIRIETDKLISEGVLLIVATLRFDCKFAEELATARAYNVKAS